jgi:tetratricopeptide (TPR) repeat protein
LTPTDQKRVTKLLKRGLNHYGLGELDEAIACWEEARAIDPDNQAVRDYLEAAYEENDSTPRSSPIPRGKPSADPARASEASLPPLDGAGDDENDDTRVRGALTAFRDGRFKEAYEALDSISRAEPDRLEVLGYMELVRKKLMQEWAYEIGDRGRVPQLVPSPPEMMKLDLKPDEAFLLSQVDGIVNVDDLISLSNADRFRALEILARCFRENILA